jgi:nucleoside-diphosphate-sugar epimerase
LIQILEKITDAKARVEYAVAKPGDVRHSLADIGRAKAILQYQPKISVEEGLRRSVAAYQSEVAAHRSAS